MRYNRLSTFLFSLLVFAEVSNYALCQNPVLGRRGFQLGEAYTADQLETISTVTGNLSYRIPLASLPPGPTGNVFPLSLIYNSQVWDVSPSYQTGKSGFKELFQMPQNSASGGWRYSYSYHLDVRTRPTPPTGVNCNIVGAKNDTLTKMTFPDGSEHVFIPNISATLGSDTNDGYFNVIATTMKYSLCSGGGDISTDLNFYTTDGTYARLVIHNDGNHQPLNWMNRNWSLYLGDGTVLRTEPTPDW